MPDKNCPAFFMAVWMYKYVHANYKSRRGRLRVPSGTYWGPIDKYLLHCIRTFRAVFEMYSTNFDLFKFHSKRFFFDTVFDISQNVSNPARIPARIYSFTSPDGGIWNNHLICFTPLHSNVSNHIYQYQNKDMYMQITTPDGGIVKTNRQVFTPLHSNVSNWVRPTSTQYQNCSKRYFFDTIFDTHRNRFESRLEPRLEF